LDHLPGERLRDLTGEGLRELARKRLNDLPRECALQLAGQGLNDLSRESRSDLTRQRLDQLLEFVLRRIVQNDLGRFVIRDHRCRGKGESQENKRTTNLHILTS
jgi:hypothetical protein